jgi:hypothetical protein
VSVPAAVLGFGLVAPLLLGLGLRLALPGG